jgi:intein-encoded DNA endonuclease-like protein
MFCKHSTKYYQNKSNNTEKITHKDLRGITQDYNISRIKSKRYLLISVVPEKAFHKIQYPLIIKIFKTAKCQWLMPIILGTWEAEIKRIVV